MKYVIVILGFDNNWDLMILDVPRNAGNKWIKDIPDILIADNISINVQHEDQMMSALKLSWDVTEVSRMLS